MDNLNILLKYLVNSDDVKRIASSTAVEEDVVEKTCVLLFDALIPTDFTRQEGSHLEKKDLNAITSNFNKLLEGNSLKKIISDVALDKAVEQSKVAGVVKELLVNIRGRLQYMTAAKKKPEEAQEKPKEAVKKPVEAKKEVELGEEKKTRVIERKKPADVETIEEESDEEDTDLTKGEKIALGVVGILLVAVIIVIVVILLKIKG